MPNWYECRGNLPKLTMLCAGKTHRDSFRARDVGLFIHATDCNTVQQYDASE